MEKIYPESLKAGDKVALIAPAGQVTPEQCERAKKLCHDLSLNYELRENFAALPYHARTTESAVNELHQAFLDPTVKGIFALRGGYGSARLLPYLDWSLIRNHPKILIGFSDITAILNTIYLKTGLVTYHGPNAGSEISKQAFSVLQKTLFSPQDSNDSQQPVIVGGNLSMIASLLGTPYSYTDWENKILLLEETNEYLYRVDRLLLQLALAGVFEQVTEVLLGNFNHIKNQTDSWQLSHVIDLYINPGRHHSVENICGHIENNLVFPIGGSYYPAHN